MCGRPRASSGRALFLSGARSTTSPSRQLRRRASLVSWASSRALSTEMEFNFLTQKLIFFFLGLQSACRPHHAPQVRTIPSERTTYLEAGASPSPTDETVPTSLRRMPTATRSLPRSEQYSFYRVIIIFLASSIHLSSSFLSVSHLIHLIPLSTPSYPSYLHFSCSAYLLSLSLFFSSLLFPFSSLLSLFFYPICFLCSPSGALLLRGQLLDCVRFSYRIPFLISCSSRTRASMHDASSPGTPRPRSTASAQRAKRG